MRRTYKSKKETGAGFGHTGVLRHIDDKCSVFDAFFIKNIKQTKRELSSINSANHHGGKSDKVRRKKYVKRLVRNKVLSPEESLSPLTYLTPDKSMHVKKAPDLFDQLLNSSNMTAGTPKGSKIDPFNQLLHFSNVATATAKAIDIDPFDQLLNSSNVPKATNKVSDIDPFDQLLNSSNVPKATSKVSDIDPFDQLLNSSNAPKATSKVSDIDPFDQLLNSSNVPRAATRVSDIDPFDQLLNSTTTEDLKPKHINLSDEFAGKRETRAYRKKELSKTRKYNYSSESSDSEKENTFKNKTCNISDIKTHNLKIEKENKTSPKHFDESIANIVKNLPKLNSVHGCQSFNGSFKNNLRYKINRLSRNLKSPTLKDSPLSSTPFIVKNRSKSIYKISPIKFDLDKSPNFVTIQENINDEYVTKVNSDNDSVTISLEENAIASPIIHLSKKRLKIKNDLSQHPISSTNSIHLSHNNVTKSNAYTGSENIVSVEDTFQVTETEPFLGFFDVKLSNDNNDLKTAVVCETENIQKVKNLSETSLVESMPSQPFFGFSTADSYVDISSESDVSQNFSGSKFTITEQHCSDVTAIQTKENDVEVGQADYSLHRKTNKSVSDDASAFTGNDEDESLYDTCDSEQSINNEEHDVKVKKPTVVIERLDHSVFQRYYSKILESTAEVETSPLSKSSNDNLSYNNTEYDSNNNSNTDSDIEDDQLGEEGDIIINYTKYEDAADAIENINSDTINVSTDCSESQFSLDNTVNLDKEDTDSDCIKVNENNIEINSNDDEERCFVTTRKRNNNTNDVVVTSNSYCSSSSDCNNTVLSITDVNLDRKSENYNKSHLIESNEKLKMVDSDDANIISVIDSENVSPNKANATESLIKTERTSFVSVRKSSRVTRTNVCEIQDDSVLTSTFDEKPAIVLLPGKKWERSLSIYRRMTMMSDCVDQSLLEDETLKNKGRKYRQSVISTMEMQDLIGSQYNESINSRRSTFVSKPSRSTIRIVKEPYNSRTSLCSTTVLEDFRGFINEDCDDTVIDISRLSITDHDNDVTVLNNFHDTSGRLSAARDYVLRRCNQTEPILFDECYPDSVLKNCRKIGEGVYGEVFLWRAGDGRARVLKIVPIAGDIKVNGEPQKDFHEIISEIVIAMELSALRSPIDDFQRRIDGKDVDGFDLHAIEYATDIFNEVLAVRCVYGPYPSRLLDLWELYDETRGSENDNPASLPDRQLYIVLELANAGEDLESYQFNSAEQAYALFVQVAFGLAVGEESYQFEHRDLHWGNVLIAPTDQKCATVVIRGRSYRVPRCGVAATIIDYSLSRLSLPLSPSAGAGGGAGEQQGERAALYNDLGTDDSLFGAVGDYQFEVYRLMRDKLGNDWKNFEPYTNILWLHYTLDKMITALRYKRTNTKIHKQYINKLRGLKGRILEYDSAAQLVLTDNEFHTIF